MTNRIELLGSSHNNTHYLEDESQDVLERDAKHALYNPDPEVRQQGVRTVQEFFN